MATARPLNPILGGRRLWPKLELHRLNMSGSVGVVAYLLNLRCGRRRGGSSRRQPIHKPFSCLHDCSGCTRLERLAGWGLHPL